jgi:OOP family OmpA-OmpF porin
MRVWAVALAVALFGIGTSAGLQEQSGLTASALARQIAETGSASLPDSLFDEGSATLREESRKILASVGELLQSDASLKIEIQVHTDDAGGAATNLRLSRSRAAALKSYLVDNLGIAPERLAANGLGQTRPVASNATEEGRARNRRVDLVKK